MTGGRRRLGRLGIDAAALGLAACLGLTSCSSNASSTTTTTRVGPSRPATAAVYRSGSIAVEAAFPGTPRRQANPAPFALLLPAGSSSVAWSIGDLGALAVHSYELVIATFPPKTPLRIIDDFLTHYGGAPNTTRYGRPALHRLDSIPLSGGTRYSGITAFSLGTVLVIAVGFDSATDEVSAFTASVRLVSS